MPAIVKVKVIEGKNLPIMDRASDLTDAFVELRLGNTTYKTEVCRKSLNPRWNSDWFKFEVDDEEIQEEYLQIKVLDYDVYSSHDAIGKVTINLDTNIVQNGTKEMSGYYPIYDTLHGIRGYVKLKIRTQFFIDANKYRQTSCGIKFFSTNGVPHGFTAIQFQGFVEELLVDDDPEYQWIEKIRTSRASNEARQRHISKLSGEVKRKIGLKVLEMGGNAVIGYQQQFDLEGETGLVVRSIGTSVTLLSENDNNTFFSTPITAQSPEQHLPPGGGGGELIHHAWQHRLSHPSPHGVSFSSEPDYNTDKLDPADIRLNLRTRNHYTGEMEFPFFTINCPPQDFVLHLGGVVSSRSVKLLDKINNPDDPETRDGWWNELRIEIRSHMKAMGCTAVIGYTETTSICDDLIVLSASGTAAVVVVTQQINTNNQTHHEDNEDGTYNVLTGLREDGGDNGRKYSDSDDKKPLLKQDEVDEETIPSQQHTGHVFHTLPGCHICHVPYSDVELPLPVTLQKCVFCRQDHVPDILLSTTDIPDEIPFIGTGSLIQARVVRLKKKEKGESDAENVSQILPFLEFDLHQQLINKLKVKGMNAVFGLKTRLSIGEEIIIAVTTGTAVYLSALPPPPVIVLTSRADAHKEKDEFSDMQTKLMAITKHNKEFFNLSDIQDHHHKSTDENNEPKEKGRKLDLLIDGKESYVFELDDKSDGSIFPLMNETNFEGFHVFNTEATPGVPLFKSNQKGELGYESIHLLFLYTSMV
ncbi:C2 domain-containing protein 5-like [Clytia hemisphaerica]|uniref:C2 domain-containing protein 5-like n=1 Tax=Clytia hemisphaerica TaxID=252671 RepID=UPI0034D5BA25